MVPLTLCRSRLPSKQKAEFVRCAKLLGAVCVDTYSDGVTHLVSSPQPLSTKKVMMALLDATPCVTVEWLQALVSPKAPTDPLPHPDECVCSWPPRHPGAVAHAPPSPCSFQPQSTEDLDVHTAPGRRTLFEGVVCVYSAPSSVRVALVVAVVFSLLLVCPMACHLSSPTPTFSLQLQELVQKAGADVVLPVRSESSLIAVLRLP